MSQNILVNWKVNTDEVAKSRDILTQANAAANKFQQTATQGAKSSKDAMAALVAEEKRLEAAIKGTQRTSFTSYAAFSKQLQGLSRQYSDVKVKIDQATKAIREQEKAQQELNKQTGTMSKAFGALGTAIQAAFSLATLRAAVNFALETARLAGNIEGVNRAFNKLPAATLILDNLRQATLGTVNDLELMQKALSAKNFGISLQALPRLLEFAAVRAQQTGQSVDYLVNSIVTGIGRKSLLILDNLQISATEINKELDGMSIKAASVGQVSEAIGRIAERELDKMGGSLTTAATRVDRLTASYDNLKATLATLATTSGPNGRSIFDLLAGGMDIAADKLSGKSGLESVTDRQALKDVQAFLKELGPDAAQNIETVQQKLNSLVQVIGGYNDVLRANKERRQELFSPELLPSLERLSQIYGKQNEAGEIGLVLTRKQIALRNTLNDQRLKELENLGKENSIFVANKMVVEATIPLLKQYMEALTVGANDPVEQLGLIQQKLDEIESVSDKINAAKSTGEIHNLNIELEKLNGELADLKAFGTTKRQLIVNGQLKLVPVVAPKNQAETLAPDSRDFTDQLDDFIKNSLIGLGPYNLKLNLDYNRSAPSKTPGAIQNIGPMASPQEIVPMDEWEKIGQEFADNWQSILGQGLGDTTSFFDSVLQAEADNYDARINQSRQYYDRLMILAGDNEKAKDRLRLKEQKEENKLRREAFEADKRAKRASAVINGAAGVINAFATLPYPAAIVAAALIAAETAAQIAVINRQQPRFAKGVIDLKGPGTKTSDSIPAKLSKGESVMTADETSSAGGILRDIRAGKLNDRKLAKQLDAAVLRDLKLTKDGVKMVGMDDSRIVKKLDQLMNAQPDYMEKSGILWKTKEKSENYKKWVRAKIM